MKRSALFLCTLLAVLPTAVAAAAADVVNHGVISIASDYQFTPENGVCSGTGTSQDPYIIEGWSIDAGEGRYGIRIHGTSRPFIVRNVLVSGASTAAVSLSYVRNARLENCTFEANWAGVNLSFSTSVSIARCTFDTNTDGAHLFFSDSNEIVDSVFYNNDTALWLDSSDGNTFTGNVIERSRMGAYLNLSSKGNTFLRNAFVANLHNAFCDEPNIWNDETSGNYWSNYAAVDADLDGIWDTPYTVRQDGDQDALPLVTHPLVPVPPAATCGR